VSPPSKAVSVPSKQYHLIYKCQELSGPDDDDDDDDDDDFLEELNQSRSSAGSNNHENNVSDCFLVTKPPAHSGMHGESIKEEEVQVLPAGTPLAPPTHLLSRPDSFMAAQVKAHETAQRTNYPTPSVVPVDDQKAPLQQQHPASPGNNERRDQVGCINLRPRLSEMQSRRGRKGGALPINSFPEVEDSRSGFNELELQQLRGELSQQERRKLWLQNQQNKAMRRKAR
jgi:hypothetical protein